MMDDDNNPATATISNRPDWLVMWLLMQAICSSRGTDGIAGQSLSQTIASERASQQATMLRWDYDERSLRTVDAHTYQMYCHSVQYTAGSALRGLLRARAEAYMVTSIAVTNKMSGFQPLIIKVGVGLNKIEWLPHVVSANRSSGPRLANKRTTTMQERSKITSLNGER